MSRALLQHVTTLLEQVVPVFSFLLPHHSHSLKIVTFAPLATKRGNVRVKKDLIKDITDNPQLKMAGSIIAFYYSNQEKNKF